MASIAEFCSMNPVFRVALLLSLLLPALLLAQETQTFDTIPAKPEVKPLSNLIFQFDNRRERYYNVRGRMNGLKIGLEFYKRVRLGIGFYANNDFYRIEPPQGVDSLFRTARFNYATAFTEVVVFRNFRWELAVSSAIGRGGMEVNRYNLIGSSPSFISTDNLSGIGVFDIGGNGHFKVFPWLGIGFGSGVRRIYDLDDANLRSAFTDPYFELKLKLFIGYAYRSIFKPASIEQEKAYYDYRHEKRLAFYESLFP